MSLLLIFSATTPAAVTFGPFQEIRFDGETIRTSPGGQPLAVHRSHAWEVGAERYVRVDCSAPVTVHFVARDGAASAKLGPFAHLSCVDGVCYVDREVFAVVDRALDDWYSIKTERHWATMVVTAAF